MPSEAVFSACVVCNHEQNILFSQIYSKLKFSRVL